MSRFARTSHDGTAVLAVALGLGAIACEPAPPAATAASIERQEAATEAMGSVTATLKGTTCEAARDAWNFEAAARREKPSMGVFGSVLAGGEYLQTCNVSPSTAVVICVAVVQGEVHGMTVRVEHGTQKQADCVVREVARLKFPVASMMSIGTTTFGAE